MLNKINLKNLFAVSLILFNLVFYSSILYVKGYPQTNDILHIFKLTSLEGNLKFINGIYGPGYAYYTLLFSNSLTILSFIIIGLSFQSSYLIYLITTSVSQSFNKVEEFFYYLIIIVFHFIIIVTLGFNHSDSIFLLLLYNGILAFVIGYYLKDNLFIIILGSTLIGISIIFRHHGPIFIFFLFCIFLFYEIFSCKQKIYLNYKKYLLVISIIIAPLIISQYHLSLIDVSTEWQTGFKLHYFLHGDKWGDWRDLKYVLQSNHYLNFNIYDEKIGHLISITLNHLKGVLRYVYPFLFCFLLAFYAARKNIILFSLLLFSTYLIIVLPGYHRGYFPSIFICFIIILLSFKEIIKYKSITLLILVFLIGHLVYLTSKHISYLKESHQLNVDINKNIVPILKNKNIRYSNIFSDDYNFYTTKLDGKINELCNWGGWLLNHPYLENYYPDKVLNGDDVNYCDVRALITNDKEFAEQYLSNSNREFDEHYKFDIYYLFIR